MPPVCAILNASQRHARRRSSSPCAYLHMPPLWQRPSCQNMPWRYRPGWLDLALRYWVCANSGLYLFLLGPNRSSPSLTSRITSHLSDLMPFNQSVSEMRLRMPLWPGRLGAKHIVFGLPIVVLHRVHHPTSNTNEYSSSGKTSDLFGVDSPGM